MKADQEYIVLAPRQFICHPFLRTGDPQQYVFSMGLCYYHMVLL